MDKCKLRRNALKFVCLFCLYRSILTQFCGAESLISRQRFAIFKWHARPCLQVKMVLTVARSLNTAAGLF